MGAALNSNRRMDDRFSVAPMYTAITAQRSVPGDDEPLAGHAYDISAGGMRFELDRALEPGEQVTMRISLPGSGTDVGARGEVVWVNDDLDDPGPRRMALRFADFSSPGDRARLLSYLGGSRQSRAAA